MNIEQQIKIAFIDSFEKEFNHKLDESELALQQTRKEIVGDYTINVFPYVRFAKRKPEDVAEVLGKAIAENIDKVRGYNVIKGFLNLEIADSYWLDSSVEALEESNYGFKTASEDSAPIVIEYSSPNTNKPLHLGHIRNNLLGYSIAEILKASGENVKKVNLVNDRGIHICKSMLSWERHGNGETPESSGEKGDHLVGKYYVKFDQEYKAEIKELVEGGMSEKEAGKEAPIIKEAQQMLRDWEAKEPKVYQLWKMMNDWVYAGFDITYKRLGVDFDKIYYESETYLLGKEIVMKGFEDGILYQNEDGSIWANLEDEGLDQKLLLRADGTSVYMTQDIGTAKLRIEDYNPKAMLYVVGNEQNYHFDVLKIVLKKLGYDWAERIEHISYGMVELPNGKMKSREGTVVDADDLIDDIIKNAADITSESGKLEGLNEDEANNLFRQIGLGALKFFILKVDPKKKMLFDPSESIDFNGNTGPFIQYTHARIQSVIRKSNDFEFDKWDSTIAINDKERSLLRNIYNYSNVIQNAAKNYSPAMIASYAYDLAKEYNQFYHDNQILKEEDRTLASFRLDLSRMVANIIRSSMGLLGIEVPNQM
jgi:arginyl-tRNA synthetase